VTWSGDGRASARLADAAAFGVALGRGTVQARVADHVLSATVDFPGARISGSATGRLAPGHDVAVVLRFADLSLEPLVARVAAADRPEIAGAVTGVADLAVPVATPTAARGSVRLDAVRLVIAGEEWRNRGPVVLQRRPEVTRLERVHLASAAGSLDVTGSVEDGGRLDLAGRAQLPLAALAALRPEIAQASGMLEIDARVAGTTAAPDVSGEGSIRDGRIVARDFPALPVTGLRARFVGDRQRVRIAEVIGDVGGGQVRARGDVVLGDRTPRVDLAMEGRVPLAVVATLRPEIREASGTLAFSGTVSGAATAPAVRGAGSIEDGHVVARDVPTPVTGLRARFTLSPDRLHVADAVATIEGGDVRASGDIVFAQPAPRLDVTIAGRIPLGPLAALRPEIREASGFVDVKATVTGTTAAPQAAGEGSVRDARLTLRDHAESLRDIQARFTATPAGIRVASASASFGGGRLAATGDVALEGREIGSYRFDLDARGVALEPLPGFNTSWDADLELVGFEERSQLRGTARLLRGTYVSDLPLLQLLLQPRRGSGGGATGPGLPLEVRVSLDDNLVVRTSVARFRAGGVVTLQGTTAAPILFGAVETTEGQLIFRKQRFTITSASARFTDPRRVDPLLDVQAQARIQTYDVTLHVSGRSDRLEIRMASSPSLPEEDILSLIAFGTTREQLARGGAGAVAGLIVQDLFGLSMGDGAGPVDIFEMQTTDADGRTVRVGKRIGDRAMVLYSQGIENTDERRLRLEYEVVGPLVVAGEQNFRGGFGA
ncbi:MAG: translocation/assembly module TamB domain-containing protein, partial [Candidatus Rokuibacteriota bacterium]